MSPLFDPDLVYPSDGTGYYQDFEGKIVKSEDLSDLGFAYIHVEVEGVGSFSGVWRIPDAHRDDPRWIPPIGGSARIRIYDAGGGWYPDNEIMGWTWKPTSTNDVGE